jgi:hypothetical protein
MIDVGMYICQPYNIAHYEQYGEANSCIVSHISPRIFHLSQALQKLRTLPPSLTRLDIRKWLKISRYQTFVLDMQSHWCIHGTLRSLRAIVLSSDASDCGITEMHHAFTAALPVYRYTFRITLDPHLISVFGATLCAYHVIQSLDFTAPQTPGYLPGNPNGHTKL